MATIACQKDFSLHISAGCFDWASWNWTGPPDNVVYNAVQGGPVTLNFDFNPKSGGCGFYALGVSSPPPGYFAAIQSIGNRLYDGESCNCLFHVRVTTGGNIGNQAGGVQITRLPATSLAAINFLVDPNGTFDFPFVLPDATAAPYTLQITYNWQLSSVVGGPTSFEVDGYIARV